QSTPDHLTAGGQQTGAVPLVTPTAATRSPKKTRVKTKSVGNLNEKVRLQVVYKPPFKFSLKLSKTDPSAVSGVKTHIVPGAAGGKRKSRPLTDRKRVGPGGVVVAAGGEEQNPPPRKRSAILVRQPVPVAEEKLPIIGVSEPNYETLNPRNGLAGEEDLAGADDGSHTYENITFGHGDEPDSISTTQQQPNVPSINTATFRISRSASGTRLQNPLAKSSTQPFAVGGSRADPQRGSTSNLVASGGAHSSSHHSNSGGRDRQRRSSVHNSSSSAFRAFGGDSTECLIRSSTTNLAKPSHSGKRNSFADKKRSSSTNLSRHQSGSASNLHSLKRHGSSSQMLPQQESNGGSRRNSITQPTKLSRSASNGPGASGRYVPGSGNGTLGSNNSANSSNGSHGHGHHSHHHHHHHTQHQRRSSVGTSSKAVQQSAMMSGQGQQSGPVLARQTSLNVKSNVTGQQHAHHAHGRPHTAACADDPKAQRPFEWPMVPTSGGGGRRPLDEPLPSDLEVMVSDVENLVSDR
uniref:Uncharacterized protein n=1 Tax=Anopheles maculatus TaxID=74869 RepID=A0A182T5E7_9DIPT